MPIPPPTRRELAVLLDQQPAYPADTPIDKWSAAELRAFIDFHDLQIAQQQQPIVTAHTPRKAKITR